jgi:hypothetical protein
MSLLVPVLRRSQLALALRRSLEELEPHMLLLVPP